MEIFKQTNFDFLGKKWPFIFLSLALTAAGLVSLWVKGGPRYGIDFTGGALMDVNFIKRPPADQIRAALRKRVAGTVDVQEVTGSQEVLISTGTRNDRPAEQTDQVLQATRDNMITTLNAAFNPDSGGKLDINTATRTMLADRLRDPLAKAGAALSDDQIEQLAGAITSFRDTPPRSGLIRNLDDLSAAPGVTPQVRNVIKQQCVAGNFNIRSFEFVGPKIGADLRQQAINVVLIALGAMLVYIAFRFEWIYGVAAVIAVFHDTIITIGLFSLFNKPIDLTVIAALLTLVGYSMNDTIVTFDRIRENLRLQMRGSFSEIVNRSINQTLSRTVLTSGLTFLTALSLYLFGGQVLNGFSFALVVGIIVGTYSSIFIASPILIFWQDIAEGRKRRGPARPAVVESRTRNVAKPVKPVRAGSK
ncbi:MAG: protein translocase subunit SecF [Acidobacteriaceae bacterium]|nr:protein translocase subunit SecF [Acidobacteriaceae bacterium]MBV8573124.1 protein translocase subunit SecF [Acidobacteriaceae bacterium]